MNTQSLLLPGAGTASAWQQRPGAYGLIDRAEATGRTARALDVGGAVLLGPPGIGKTAVMRAVAEQTPDSAFIWVRGSETSARTPYGALAWLLSDLPRDAVDNPVLVLRGLKELLTARAAGRQPVFVLDNADRLDDLAVMVATQLCRQGVVALLVAAPDLSACAPELTRLWSDGLLRRIDLGPLSRTSVGTLMHGVAGAPPTAEALENVWRHTGGNPLAVELTTRDQLAAGRFRLRAGYCAVVGPLSLAGELAERAEIGLRRLTATQRDALDLLALCSELPVSLFAALVGADTVDSLEERGLLAIRARGAVTARLRSATAAKVLPAVIPHGRRLDLLETYGHRLNLSEASNDACFAAGRWLASCGQTLGGEELVRALRGGRRQGDYAAVELLAAAAGRTLYPRAAVELAAARLQYRPERALEVPVADAGPDERSRLELIHVLAAAVRVGAEAGVLATKEAADHGRPEQARRQAEMDVISRLDALASGGGSAPPSALDGILQPARLEVLHRLGRWESAPSSLAGPTAGAAAVEVRLAAGTGAARSLAVTGAADEAAALAEHLLDELGSGTAEDADLMDLEAAFLELQFVLLLAGRPAVVLRICRQAACRSPHESFHPGGAVWEVPAGLAHLIAGRADAAGRVLEPALAQLSTMDRHGLYPLAAAGAAAAHVEGTTGAGLPARLRPAGRSLARSPVLAAVLTEYFGTAAGLGAAAAPRLHRLGLRNLAAGNVGAALLSLSAAVVDGRAVAVDDLARAARSAKGQAGSLYGVLSAGLTRNDAQALAQVARTALAAGQARLAYFAASAAQKAVVAGGEKRLSRGLRQLENQAYRLLADANRVEEGIKRLPDFDRTLLLRAAEGEPSSVLGRDLHLSPRTVDWHLGRMFRTLRVSGRGELREILSQTGSNEWVVPSTVP
ncbi:hypothetical protein BN1051_00820 [Arthrobacter saudimassiliensis]|uniref:HTH luxR-type domain-containing protein n=1 Tax=Arthrobacter saudimassiliensis TaxID=1461584 RepID=A0A078MMI9_9MICC|nr:hypothetical protein BN1051_00820 [Arthrobacter saudimassiliensis]